VFNEEDMTFLKPTIREFVDMIIMQTWNWYHKGIFQESNMVKRMKQALAREWKDM